jgi:5S rRNA maturation endonuclease (ribonuclease M5)
MNTDQIKKNYTCLDYLGPPLKKTASGWYIYRCPWREDKNPSLNVSPDGKRWKDWKDHGASGGIIELVQTDLGTTDFHRVCEQFNDVTPRPLSSFSPSKTLNEEKKENISSFAFFEVVPLQSRGLFAYLYSRKVNIEIAKLFLLEAHYSFEPRIDGKYLYALAYGNDKGGYELRNKYYKGGTCPKAITTHIHIDGAPVVVFEGFFDMLSFATLCGVVKHNYLVLNSTVNAPAAIEQLKEYQGRIYLCLDNDASGSSATHQMLEQLPDALDIRARFAPQKDVNEYLVQCDKITTPHANSKCSENVTLSERADVQGGCNENSTLSTSVECGKNDTPNQTEYAPMKNTQGKPNGRGQTAPVSDGVSMSGEEGACTGRNSEGLLAVPSPVGHSDACIGGP